MAMEVERVFIGAGCNRIVHNVSWGACDLLAFGVQNAVAIFCPKTAQISTTLPGHKAYVNCAHWLPSSKFAFRDQDEVSHKLIVRQEAHKRIIWACSWNPFGHEFATGSRDKTVKIWKLENGSSVKLLSTLPTFKSSITALSWLGVERQKNHGILAAVGMENGLIELWTLSTEAQNDVLAVHFDPFMCHVSAVHRLRWRNTKKEEYLTSSELASCGADHCVRIFQVRV